MKTISIAALLSVLLLVGSGQSQDSGAPVKRVYNVPPSFHAAIKSISGGSAGVSADPFAPGPPRLKIRKKLSAQEYLIECGIVFDQDSSAAYNRKADQLTVINTPEQLELVEAVLQSIRDGAEKQVVIFLEYIEVDHNDFSDWLFENVMDSDGTKLRKEVQTWVKAGRAEIIESATVVARSGNRAKVESVDQYIYPTEYDPPEIPNEITLKDGAEAPITAASPTAFETRNLGVTLEVDPVLGADNATIDLNLSPELVELEKVEAWHNKAVDPKFMTHMPSFYLQKITTQVTAQHGRYVFIGATRPLKAANPERKNPYVLQFVRGYITSVADWSIAE